MLILNLPAGKYLVIAKADLSTNNGSAGNCYLNSGSVELDHSGTGVVGISTSTLNLSLQATVGLPGGGSVVMNCSGQVIALAKMTAIAVDAVN